MPSIYDAVDISELGQSNLWVIWGRSGAGKTELGSTFPKPMLYIGVGDDGSNTIAGKEGIKAIKVEKASEVRGYLEQAVKDTKYASVFVDTFSMFTNMWIDENATQKKKKMTQQMWGDLKVETEELVKLSGRVAKTHCVILSCHESNDTIEGMEDEIIPDFRPNTTKGARTYLEGMANYGIHCTKIQKEGTDEKGLSTSIVKYAADLGANPYYWTKFQVATSVKIPKRMINPTYKKIMKLIEGGNE